MNGPSNLVLTLMLAVVTTGATSDVAREPTVGRAEGPAAAGGKVFQVLRLHTDTLGLSANWIVLLLFLSPNRLMGSHAGIGSFRVQTTTTTRQQARESRSLCPSNGCWPYAKWPKCKRAIKSAWWWRRPSGLAPSQWQVGWRTWRHQAKSGRPDELGSWISMSASPNWIDRSRSLTLTLTRTRTRSRNQHQNQNRFAAQGGSWTPVHFLSSAYPWSRASVSWNNGPKCSHEGLYLRLRAACSFRHPSGWLGVRVRRRALTVCVGQLASGSRGASGKPAGPPQWQATSIGHCWRPICARPTLFASIDSIGQLH